MNRKKVLLMVLLTLALLVSVILGVRWNMRNYVLVDLQFYPRGVQQLDLRDRAITIRHYEKLLRRLPGCEIQWNVPFQNGAIPCGAEEIAVSALAEQDIRNLKYLERLKRVNAEGCTDYEQLLMLKSQRPDLQVEYTVRLGSVNYSSGAKRVVLRCVTPEEVSLLPYLPELRGVLCGGGEKETISQLQEYCRNQHLELQFSIGGKGVSADAKTVAVGAITDQQMELLQYFPNLKRLHIRQPKASGEKLTELRQSRPDITITWEQEICGRVFPNTVEEIDLSGAEISSLRKLDQQMDYFPDTELVFLGECGLDNDQLAAFRERVRNRYKLVWTVSCGNKLKARTDDTTFMPLRERVYYFNDEEAYNLRYCEDMVCIDIGHMSIHDIEFVKYMPNLEYLILAHTQVQYIEPISTCKKLKFLELDWSPVRDLTPLKGCTALEDLNLGKTYADFEPVGEMTWLKNLWMVNCSAGARYRMTQALPDTRVMVTGSATVANGWRNLDNYYKMRDLLGMYYMSW